MACTTESERLLRNNDLRVTRQRLAVLKALRHADQHITATDVYARAKDEAADLNASTVYRTLTQLRDLGLVSQTDLGGGERTFAWRSERPHHHLVCTSCGRMTELDHNLLANFADQLERDFGFEAHPDHWAVYGRCQDCNTREHRS